jgi:hypothetical protein
VSDARHFQDACAEVEASRPARGNNERSASQVMTKTKMAPRANRMKTAKGMKADPVMRGVSGVFRFAENDSWGFLTIPCVQVAPITARNKMLVEDSLRSPALADR